MGTVQAPQHEYLDVDALVDDYHERGWTDGLPIVAPTPEKVERFLAVAGLRGDEVLGHVPTREVTVTAEQVAINAVMAGCRAEYLPTVIAAVRAHLHEKANCHSTTGTLSGAFQMVIVNGPARAALGVACEGACFGPGFRANATIGRALRLVIRNACRAIPGFLDRASFSTPARYSMCFGEDEEGSGATWRPMHVERGFAATDSTVTVQSVMVVVPATDFTARTPEAVCDTLVATIRSKGTSGDAFLEGAGEVVVVIGPEHRRFFLEAGWSKDDIRANLHPRITALDGPGRPVKFPDTEPERLLLVAAGGPGMGESWVFIPHLSRAITEPIRTAVTTSP